MQVRVVAVTGVEVAQSYGGRQLLGDDGGKWIAEKLKTGAIELLWVLDERRFRSYRVSETDVELEFETCASDGCSHRQT